MKNKILRNNTVVPAELYVERAADRQLRKVIDEMGRPPYILVARQMGKTNLLLNMKRERIDDIVLYLDLSNRFDTSRQWFRNIIDMLLDINSDIFGSLQDLIVKQRLGDMLEPSTEYDRHLRMLLRNTAKKVVIVLDEIDSLVGCSYSDVVLAQVRSMYFSRTNFDDYSRLTYVLSGVAEPSELIKNKDISPFNIGEKIYLEDFEFEEFMNLLEKLSVTVEGDIAVRIFDWVSGNPRMTWDVCSEVEDRLLLGQNVVADDIDDIIYHLYLRDFDRAPIDHMRTLVESDSRIRSAIMSLRYGNTEFPEDKVKSRLYLAGITNAAGGAIRIKNKIIDHALSDSWIEQISNVQQSYVDLASEAYVAKKYELAIEYYESALAESVNSTEVTPIRHLELALCYKLTNQLAKALHEFGVCYELTDEPALKQISRFYSGIALLAEKRFGEGRIALQEASLGPVWATKINAEINILFAYLNDDSINNGELAIALGEKVIGEIRQKEQSETNIDFLVNALYNSSRIHSSLGNKNQAQELIREALKIGPQKYHPCLLISEYSLLDNLEQKTLLCSKLHDSLVYGDLELSHPSEFGLGLTKNYIGQALCCLEAEGKLADFNGLLTFVGSKYYKGKLSSFNVLLDLYSKIQDVSQDEGFGVSLLVMCEKFYMGESISTHEKLKLYRNLIVATMANKDNKYKIQFMRELEYSCPVELISEEDVQTFILVANSLLTSRDVSAFLYARKVWGKFKGLAVRKYVHWAALIVFYEMTYFGSISDSISSIACAHELIGLVDGNDFSDPRFAHLGPNLRQRAQDAIKMAKNSDSTKVLSTIGRNDKVYVQYIGMPPVLKKYKQIESDLEAGICIFIAKG